MSLSKVEISFLGEKKFDSSSSMLASVGDVNADGFDDFLVGAKNNDEAGENAGICYLVFGRKEGLPEKFVLGGADVIISGVAANDHFGAALSGVGDVNGDGIDDFVVGSPYADGEGENLGVVYLFFGRKDWKKKLSAKKADTRLIGERDDDTAGMSVSFAGDVNGDGYHDFLVGAPGNDDAGSNSGKVYLILGKDKWNLLKKLSSADASFIGEDKENRAGTALAFAGDVNGDGLDDFLVGAAQSSYVKENRGQTYLFFGKASVWPRNGSVIHADASFVGEMAGDNSGFSVASAGDVNGDRFSDILIGAPKYSGSGPKSGAVYLFLGGKTGWKLRTEVSEASWIIWGERKRDAFGVSVAGVGDIDGDGLDDFVVGANKNREVSKKAGKIYLFTGRKKNPPKNKEASQTADFMLLGEKRGDYAGVVVAFAGDIDGDGTNEFLVGADSNSENGKTSGKGYLVSYRKNKTPLDLERLRLMTDETFKEEMTGEITRGGNLYLQMTATDPDPRSRNWGSVTVSSNRNHKIKVRLLETAPDSGIFRGTVLITRYGSNKFMSRLRVSSGETIAVIPSQKPSKLISVAQQVSFDDCFIDDDREGGSSGNGNHRLEPGEKIELKISLKNHYFEEVSGITVKLSSDDGQVKIFSDTVEYGSIKSTGTAKPDKGFMLQVDPLARAGTSVKFRISLKSIEGNHWFDKFELPVETIASISGTVMEKLSGDPLEGVVIETSDKNRYRTGSGGQFKIFLSADRKELGLRLSGPGYLKKEAVLKIDSRKGGYLIAMNRRLSLNESRVAYLGENTRDASGYSVAGVGDVNGDGYADLLIGAWSNDQGGIDSGKVYLLFGKAREKRGNSLTFADVAFIGERPYDEAGRTVSAAGDVNHDGFQDFLIGAPGNDQAGDKTGKTYLIFGKATGWQKEINLSKADVSFTGEKLHDRSGSTLAALGDVNGDGLGDFLIGASSSDHAGIDAGQAYLFLGKKGGWRKTIPVSESDGSFVAENQRDEAAKSIAYAGDVNGDGFDDILIGAPSCNQSKDFAGKTYLIFGRPEGFDWGTSLALADVSFLGQNANDAAGMAVSTAGDVNGDGFDDILIGAWSNDLGGIDAGSTYLFFGKREGWSKNILLENADAVFVGEHPYDAAGLKLSGAGDVNGDGFDDFLIGAWGSDTVDKDAGETYLILGKPTGWKSFVKLDLADFSLTGAQANDSAGRAISYAGDVDGDGYDDILIGAWSNDKGAVDAGATYLVSYSHNLPPRKIKSIKLSVSAFRPKGKLKIAPVFSPDEMAQMEDSLEKETLLELDPNKNRNLYIMLEGEDRDPDRINVAKVLISGRKNYFNNVVRLVETAPDSGLFERALKIAADSGNPRSHRIMTRGNNSLRVYSWDDGSKQAGILIKDSFAPALSDFNPKEDDKQISINSDLSLAVTDTAGIKKDSIKMSVAGEQVFPELIPVTNGYRLYYKPSESFSFGQEVKVKVMASDLSELENSLVGSYSFFVAAPGILRNPGFEDDFAFWSVKNIKGATVSLDTSVVRSGKKSCKIFFTAQADVKFLDVVQLGVPVRPDAEYLLSCYVKSRNLTSNSGIRLYIEGSDAMGRVVKKESFFNYQSGQLLETNDWTRMALNFKTLPDTQAINIYVIRWDNGEVIGGACWLDDFYLAEETEDGFTSSKMKGWFTNFLME